MSDSLFIYSNLKYEKEYDLYSDRELLKRFNMGNDQAEKCLLKKYFYLIRRIISSYYSMGYGKDDLLQESMISLLKAMKTYDLKYEITFKTYAEICIRRQIITALRKAKKFETVNIVSLFNYFDNEYLLEKLCDDSCNPEEILISEEEKNSIIEFVSQYLSDYEKSVLIEYISGKKYKEIAQVLNTDIKSVDNALQRVKKKIESSRSIIC